MPLMKGNEIIDIDICQAVSVGHHECFCVDKLLNAFNPAACHRFQACINKRYIKILLGMVALVCQLISFSQVDGEIITHRFIVEEIFFYDASFVAQAQNKTTETEMGIVL